MSRKLKFWKTLWQWKLHKIDTISTAIFLYKDGYSITDIAVCMHIPYMTVKRWVETAEVTFLIGGTPLNLMQ